MKKAVWFAGFLATVGMWSSVARAESPVGSSVYVSAVSVTEGDEGKTAFTTTVTYRGYISTPVPVLIRALPGSASAEDFEFTPVTLSLTAGIPQTVTGYILGDLEPEQTETFTLVASLGADAGIMGYFYSSNGVVSIADNDLSRASSLYIDDATVLEGNEGTTTVDMRVRLEPAATTTVTVEYAFQDSISADRPADFIPIGGTLTFAPGEVLKTVPVQIVGNTTWQGNRKAHLALSSPRIAILGKAIGTIDIVEDDQPVHAFLADQELSEGGDGPHTVRLAIQFDSPAPYLPKIWLRAESAGAQVGTDYQLPTQVIYPITGATDVSFDLTIVGDTKPGCDRGFFLSYMGVLMGDDTWKTARILIRDDDGGLPDCPDPFSPQAPKTDASVPETITRTDVTTQTTTDVTTQTTTDVTTVPPKVERDAGVAIVPSSTPDAGMAPEASRADSGTLDATAGKSTNLARHSGCAFTLAGRPAAWPGWAVLGAMAALWGRRKSGRRR